MQKNILHYISLLVIGCVLSFSSCKDDEISTNSAYKLSFSADTISFDTVFTTVTTRTLKLKVYNRNSDAIKISSIYLTGGSASPFRINVSGRTNANMFFSDVELRANDSMYIFVNSTVDPNNQNNPLLIQDKLRFSTNGNEQEIIIQAVGQDVIILKNKTIINDTVLNNTKPYLIYGKLTVETDKKLEIEKGTKLFFHDNAELIVKGSLKAVGTIQEPIVFRGDRLDNIFEGLPYDSLDGQWKGITLQGENAIHELSNVDIRSASKGLSVYAEKSMPEISLHNVRIHNHTTNGFYAKNAKVTADNSQFSNCGESCIMLLGGESTFTHCTIANYFPLTERGAEALILSNKDTLKKAVPLTKADFRNSIVSGNWSSELKLVSDGGGDFNYSFTNCIITGNSTSDTKYANCVWYSKSEAFFVNTSKYPYNFQLTKNSAARGKANLSIAATVATDKNGYNRMADNEPDAGAYEYIDQ